LREWKSDRNFLGFCTTPEDQASLLKQIADAKGQKKIQYLISVQGCYYEIECGLLKGGGKGGEFPPFLPLI
jgi:hypothetical protein